LLLVDVLKGHDSICLEGNVLKEHGFSRAAKPVTRTRALAPEGTMILHAASISAFFVDQLGPAPFVVNCAQAAQEVWWKWLARTLFQLLLGVIPVAGGVGIAIWSFRATGRKDHEHWLRDQKTVEWKGLIQAVAEFEEIMPLGEVGSSAVDGIRHKVQPFCNRISHLVSQTLFVAPVLSNHGVQSEIYQLMRDADSALGCIEAFPQSSLADKMKLGTPVENAMKIRERLQRLHAKLFSLAQADLSLS
jgi:hypothetical protein